jgi:predicted acyl esterase
VEGKNVIAKNWKTSERKYNIVTERHAAIPMSDGITIDADIFRPDGPGRFPALLGVHPYDNTLQTAPIMPVGMSVATGGIEAGDPNFYVRRGYAQIIANVRGTGRSGGSFCRYQPRENSDTYEIIEWLAGQPWCDGNVGMFGVSYFAIAAQRVVSLKPPHLKAIFAPFAATDRYRDTAYHGGILAHGFMNAVNKILSTPKFDAESWYRKKYGEERFRQAIAEALEDNELRAVPYIVEALSSGKGALETYLLNVDGEYYREQNVDYSSTGVPAYLGACWGIYGLHLPGAFRSWEHWTAAKKMTVGPPIYLDRPLYQYAYESLRWFDYWLKGMDNGIMDEPPIKVFVVGTGEWRYASEWPLPETRWTPFYLHANGLLSEHEFWPNEGASTFEDSPYNRGSLTFVSPPLVENTEVIGPLVLNLYASTTDTEVLWFVSLLDVDEEGNETLLTRGWLRGSQRAVDPERSKPWQPYHPHVQREPLTPGEIYEFNIEIRPYAILFTAGHRIGIRIKCVDDEKPVNALEGHNVGHLWRQSASRATVLHNGDYPSHLLLPVTKGNVIGTYMSGGKLPQELFPYRMW